MVIDMSKGSVAGRRIDEAFVRRAVERANSNALRLALYQATGDPELEAMVPCQKPIRGGALIQNVVCDSDLPRLWVKAITFLLDLSERPVTPQPPGDAEARRLISLFNGYVPSENYIRFGLEELAYDEFPRDAQWSSPPAPGSICSVRVLIIGAGISGIAAAVQFGRLGLSYTVIERQDDVGGTWHLNNYPDARVDTSSFLYQYKFEKGYPWPEFFAARDDTKNYLNHVVEKHDIRRNCSFGVEVIGARWDEGGSHWIVRTRDKAGVEEELLANFIISGCGLFSTPNVRPNIDGLDQFNGKIFHTATWDHSFDYSGKRVALIGTGSTGAQLMPKIASVAEHLVVFQRTPSWIFGVEGYREAVPPEVHWLFAHLPYYWNWVSYSSFDTAMQLQNAQSYDHVWRRTHNGVSALNEKLKKSLEEYITGKLTGRPDLMRKLIPEYPPLARRLVVDNGFYDAVLKPNVELVTNVIDHITASGIVTDDAVLREFDLIILASGYKVTKYLWPIDYRGRNGATLSDAWKKDGARSYLGMTMPDFPNLFMLYGPNGQPRSGGFYSWAEIWARYAASVIVSTLEGGHRVVSVKRARFEQYNAFLDTEMKEILWEVEGAGGYYNNEFGRSAVNLPFLTEDYHSMVITPNVNDFDIS